MKISFEPIKPKRPIVNATALDAGIKDATEKAKEGVKADFQKTTATWQHQPVWYITRRGTDWFIGTKDEIYGYVDQGTEPHPIPKTIQPGKRLAYFKTGFKPKSRVGYIASYQGQKASRDFRRPKQVHHPGTKAREFSKKIRVKWEKEFAKLMRAAIKKAV